MTPREAPRKTGRNITIAACIMVTLGVVISMLFWPARKPDGAAGVYYLDLNTGKILVASATQWPPIQTASGPHENEGAGVRVYLFSCQPCGNLDGKTLEEAKAMGATAIWVEKYRADAKKLLDEGDRNPETLMNGLVMRAISGTKWISPVGREGVALRNSASQLCPGSPTLPCYPH